MYEDLVEKAKVKQILLFYIFDTIIMLYKNWLIIVGRELFNKIRDEKIIVRTQW